MTEMTLSDLRSDLAIIQQWVSPNSQILDLGCGEGTLLRYLRDQKNVHGYGLEINQDRITACIVNGVNVIEQDLNKGLINYKDNSFDTVIMAQAIQAVQRPDQLLDEMLRVGQDAIITFPNFGHWRTRLYLAGKGEMPMSKTLPHSWFDTPNIHLCTVKDFEKLCAVKDIRIVNKTVVDERHQEHWAMRVWPSLLGEIAIYHVTRRAL